MSFPKEAEVVIIGGGIMGICTAYYLARRGCRRVIVLESALHLGGKSTLQCGGGFRHQFSSRIEIELTRLSQTLLRELGVESGHQFELHRNGYLFVLTRPEDVWQFKQARILQANAGVRTEWMDLTSLRQMLPMMELDDVMGATFTADDGWLDPLKVVQAYLADLKRNPEIMLLPAVSAQEIRSKAGRVHQVVTAYGAITTPIIVNAAGPWAGQVGQMAGCFLPVAPIRHQMFFTEPLEVFPPEMPTIIFPGEELGFRHKGAYVQAGCTDTEERPRHDQTGISMTLAECLAARAYRRLPALRRVPIVVHAAGLYERTPDQLPIIGKVPLLEGLYCITGFNGHGFMHAPACGLLLSEEILDGRAGSLNIDALRIERFAAMSNSSVVEHTHKFCQGATHDCNTGI